MMKKSAGAGAISSGFIRISPLSNERKDFRSVARPILRAFWHRHRTYQPCQLALASPFPHRFVKRNRFILLQRQLVAIEKGRSGLTISRKDSDWLRFSERRNLLTRPGRFNDRQLLPEVSHLLTRVGP